jgi:hypothetical protein
VRVERRRAHVLQDVFDAGAVLPAADGDRVVGVVRQGLAHLSRRFDEHVHCGVADPFDRVDGIYEGRFRERFRQESSWLLPRRRRPGFRSSTLTVVVSGTSLSISVAVKRFTDHQWVAIRVTSDVCSM